MTQTSRSPTWPSGTVQYVFFEANHLAVIAWKEPSVVQVVKYVALWMSLKLDREDEGQGLVEYALIIALVSIALVGALTLLAGGIGGVFDTIIGALGGGGGEGGGEGT